jgi:hypothetical protein
MTQAAFAWGTATDVIAAGDYDGDGKTDPAFFRPSTGQWQILYSGTNFSTSSAASFGVTGDIPIPGDYDGDGKTDLAVFHPANGQWQIQRSTDGATLAIAWGVAADIVAPGDYDGDGKTDLAVFRPSNGTWYVLESHTNYMSQWSRPLGVAGDLLAPADYSGDGRTDIAVYHPATGQWQIVLSGTGTTTTVTWGGSSDIPVPLDYDGDGRTDIAVFHPATGQWQIVPSASGIPFTQSWGVSTDRTLPDIIRTGSVAAPPPQRPETNGCVARRRFRWRRQSRYHHLPPIEWHVVHDQLGRRPGVDAVGHEQPISRLPVITMAMAEPIPRFTVRAPDSGRSCCRRPASRAVALSRSAWPATCPCGRLRW